MSLCTLSTTLYINNDRGHSPTDRSEREKITDYQKKKPPVKKEVPLNTNQLTGGSICSQKISGLRDFVN